MKTVTVQGTTGGTQFCVPESWEPLRHLGAGAYAAVAAFREPGANDFAVKKVEHVFSHPVLALRTLREVKLLTHLQHPNVLGLHRLLIDGPNFRDAYLCLEIMDSDLHQLIHGSRVRLSDYQVQCLLYQILRGLLCLRVAHVVHRDLKPGNILVEAGGGAKIADLGLARAIDARDDEHDISMLTEYVVTRYYRAPEVVLTATHYTYAVDVWSTGCILGEMLTRRPVFEGKDSLDQIRKIMSVIGTQSAEEMCWIPNPSSSWNFVERLNRKEAGGEAFQQLMASPGLNPLALDLLKHMLHFHPSRRVSVQDALVHRYLMSFGAEDDPEVIAAQAVPVMDWSFDRGLCFTEDGRPRGFDPKLFREAFKEACRRAGPREPGGGGAEKDPHGGPAGAAVEAAGAGGARLEARGDEAVTFAAAATTAPAAAIRGPGGGTPRRRP